MIKRKIYEDSNQQKNRARWFKYLGVIKKAKWKGKPHHTTPQDFTIALATFLTNRDRRAEISVYKTVDFPIQKWELENNKFSNKQN